MLIFADPGCGACAAIMPEIGRWQRQYTGELTIALIDQTTSAAGRAESAAHYVSPALFQRDREVAHAYKVNGTPSAVIVNSNGTIGSPLAGGAEAIRALLARMV